MEPFNLVMHFVQLNYLCSWTISTTWTKYERFFNLYSSIVLPGLTSLQVESIEIV